VNEMRLVELFSSTLGLGLGMTALYMMFQHRSARTDIRMAAYSKGARQFIYPCVFCLLLAVTVTVLALQWRDPISATDVILFVTPVKHCISCSIQPFDQQRIIVFCPNCTESGMVFLSKTSCSAAPRINVNGTSMGSFKTTGSHNYTDFCFGGTDAFNGSQCVSERNNTEYSTGDGSRVKTSRIPEHFNLTGDYPRIGMPAGMLGMIDNRTNGSSAVAPIRELLPLGLGRWEVLLDGTALMVGAEYLLCMDVNGTHLGKQASFGDTGANVYISPITSASPTTVPRGKFTLSLTCGTEAGCSRNANMWLASDKVGCVDAKLGASQVALIASGAMPWHGSLELDASAFAYDESLRLCTSWGGLTEASDVGITIDVSPGATAAGDTFVAYIVYYISIVTGVCALLGAYIWAMILHGFV